MTRRSLSGSLAGGNRADSPSGAGGSILNAVWLFLILSSILVAAFTGRQGEMVQALVEQAKYAMQFTLELVGVMAFFLGLMSVVREAGGLRWLARRLAPLMRRLFPDVPPDHPAMSAMIMNLASNMLGLGNAATPFGVKAMAELDRLNDRPGVATDSMALFLAINTSAVTLLPMGTIGVRAAAGSLVPDAIWIPTVVATTASTLVAVGACLLLRRLALFRHSAAAPPPQASAPEPPPEPEEAPPEPPSGPSAPASPLARGVVAAVALALLVALALQVGRAPGGAGEGLRSVLSHWLLPLFIATLLLIGLLRRVRVYEVAVAGAREGLEVGVRIAPFLVAIFVAVGMFRASGALELLIGGLDPVTSVVGLPGEALPMALLRPLSGSGAFGVMTEIMTTHGADSFVGMLVSTFQGSTETTFYVLAVYFGAARVRNGRYTLAACLAADVTGIAVATFMCHLFFA